MFMNGWSQRVHRVLFRCFNKRAQRAALADFSERRLARSMALIALLVLLISSTCQAFGVPIGTRYTEEPFIDLQKPHAAW
jgi:hypothetical protein